MSKVSSKFQAISLGPDDSLDQNSACEYIGALPRISRPDVFLTRYFSCFDARSFSIAGAAEAWQGDGQWSFDDVWIWIDPVWLGIQVHLNLRTDDNDQAWNWLELPGNVNVLLTSDLAHLFLNWFWCELFEVWSRCDQLVPLLLAASCLEHLFCCSLVLARWQPKPTWVARLNYCS